MHLDQALHQRQADTEAALRAVRRALALGEQFEHHGQQAGTDAEAVVGHVQRDGVAVRGGADADLPAFRRVTRRVVEEIGDDLHEPGAVALHGQRFRWHRRGQRVAARIDERAHLFHRGRDDGAHVDRRDVELDQAACHARHVEQVVHEGRDVADLAADDLARGAHARGILGNHAQQLRGGGDRRQRVAQFMAEHGEELVLALVGQAQLLVHGLARSDVHDHARHPARRAVAFVDGAVGRDPVQRTVGPDDPRFESPNSDLRDRVAECLGNPIAVVRVDVVDECFEAPLGDALVVAEALVVPQRAVRSVGDEVEIPVADLRRVERDLQALGDVDRFGARFDKLRGALGHGGLQRTRELAQCRCRRPLVDRRRDAPCDFAREFRIGLGPDSRSDEEKTPRRICGAVDTDGQERPIERGACRSGPARRGQTPCVRSRNVTGRSGLHYSGRDGAFPCLSVELARDDFRPGCALRRLIDDAASAKRFEVVDEHTTGRSECIVRRVHRRQRVGEFEQVRLTPLAEHARRRLDHGAVHPAQATVLVARRREEIREPRAFLAAGAADHQWHVFHVERFACAGAVHEWADIRPDFGPYLVEFLAEGRRVLFAKELDVRVVVEQPALVAPDQRHRLLRVEHHPEHHAHRRRPRADVAEAGQRGLALVQRSGDGDAFRYRRQGGHEGSERVSMIAEVGNWRHEHL
nr:hypothetical protein [Lysobacter bugurensis]